MINTLSSMIISFLNLKNRLKWIIYFYVQCILITWKLYILTSVNTMPAISLNKLYYTGKCNEKFIYTLANLYLTWKKGWETMLSKRILNSFTIMLPLGIVSSLHVLLAYLNKILSQMKTLFTDYEISHIVINVTMLL